MEEAPAAMILVGNKYDLDACAEREVSTEVGETFSKVRGRETDDTTLSETRC